ncbi:capsule biosynthesis protein [Helicobacter canadensis]|uniref:Capsule polysaccharide biosynthesis protein n=1 Tax=Helicobacter canadensis MIT 98-5491 TaxID=537970 RepID=C5ZVJ3_9HELI|nr:capsular biosynthesis protein [Helicobacter canadensis]EES88867.1 capsule polysaccharide biosynthesis protein [Helicobacter canadensis MIT 98-5491]EFR48830.1 capsule polysaccharide biosynthesis protein [Helicobacter canadensis MIT 98-5491]
MQLKEVIQQFQNRKILLLQGPVGPFFYHFSKLLSPKNQIYKINFNGGDFLFYPFGAKSYRGSLANLETFLQEFCKTYHIDCVIMFNDCRPIHKIAVKVARSLNLQTYIFEEGYIRPNFITFEKDGVNANSTLSKDPNFYLTYKNKPIQEEKNVKHSFRNMAWFAFLYWFGAFLLGWYFNNKLHHRSLSFTEMFPWFLSLFRKHWYRFSQKEDRDFILDSKKNYFVVVLQVYNDTQIKNHFEGRRIESFIKNSIRSFAKYSKKQHFLVIKHHPMDRGYKNYKKFIKRQTRKYNVNQRVIYIHDIHLPTLLKNALGCVVINSTTGLSSILHKCPTKVCGNAFYNIQGLTYQESLNKFWKAAKKYKINQTLFERFRSFLIDKVQINRSFYGKLS